MSSARTRRCWVIVGGMIKTRPIAIAILGIAARLYVSTLGYTQDLVYLQKFVEVYRAQGFMAPMDWGIVHFGPVFPALWIMLSWLPIPFGTALVLFNSAVDCAIAWLLWRWVGGTVAVLFWLNPILIIVTGYQRVSEQAALGLGLAAMVVLETVPVRGADPTGADNMASTSKTAGSAVSRGNPATVRTLIAALLLGLSLATKHDLALLPLWLAVRRDA